MPSWRQLSDLVPDALPFSPPKPTFPPRTTFPSHLAPCHHGQRLPSLANPVLNLPRFLRFWAASARAPLPRLGGCRAAQATASFHFGLKPLSSRLHLGQRRLRPLRLLCVRPVPSASDGAPPCPRGMLPRALSSPLGPALPHLGHTWVSPPSPFCGGPRPACLPTLCPHPDLPRSSSLAQSPSCRFLHVSEPIPVLQAPTGPVLVAARSVAWVAKIWVFVCSSGTLFSRIPVLRLRLLLEFLAQGRG